VSITRLSEDASLGPVQKQDKSHLNLKHRTSEKMYAKECKMLLRLTSIAILLSWLLMACSSMSLRVTSNPEKASVFLKKGQQIKKLGETPLEIDSNQLGEGDNYNLVIQKEGFQSESVLIERRSMSSQAEIYANLKKSEIENERERSLASSVSEQEHRSLASIQAQLFNQNYPQAEILARDFVNAHPYSPVGWSLLGNSYLLQNRNGEALKAYERALEFDPNNPDTLKMVNFLKQSPLRRGR
jgi:tetratricopeptide (TPR) repeat protein